MIMGNMTEVHTLNDQGLAEMYLHASYGDADVHREVIAELHRRWPYLAGWCGAATVVGAAVVGKSSSAFGVLMRDYLGALQKIQAGIDPAEVFARMAPSG